MKAREFWIRKGIKNFEDTRVYAEHFLPFDFADEGVEYMRVREVLPNLTNSLAEIVISDNDSLRDELTSLRQANQKMMEALRFYGDKKSYSKDHTEYELFSRWCILYGDVEEINDSVGYGGRRARQTIEDVKKILGKI